MVDFGGILWDNGWEIWDLGCEGLMCCNIVVKESGKDLGIILSCDILPSVSEILEVREGVGVGISLFRVEQVVHELAKVSGRFQTHQVSRVVLVG